MRALKAKDFVVALAEAEKWGLSGETSIQNLSLRFLQRYRGFTTSLNRFSKTTRQPKDASYYEVDHVATPAVNVVPGMQLPTAAQWMQRRGPALPRAKISKLFRTRHIRFTEPETNLCFRARRDRILQPGSRLLIPNFVFGESLQKLSEKKQKALKRDPESLEIWDDLKRRILHSDDEFHILDKPARLVVQGEKRVSMAALIKSGLKFAEGDTTKLVHRLDKDTSGAMILARNKDAAAWIGEAFIQAGRQAKDPGYVRIPGYAIEKSYWAIVEGFSTPKDEGLIDANISSETDGKPFNVPACSHFKVMARGDKLSWLELKPITGKKHQLRLHCAQILKSPIKGDIRYGASLSETAQPGVGNDKSAFLCSQTPKIYLHSRSITIRRPQKPALHVTAPLPPHMQILFEKQGWRVPEAEANKTTDGTALGAEAGHTA